MTTPPSQSPQRAPEPERELLRRYAAGDPEAIDALVGMFLNDVLRYAHYVCGDPDSAHEAAQETFLILIEKHATFDPERRFRPWFFVICRRACHRALRTRTKDARVVDLDAIDVDASFLASEEPRVLDELIRKDNEDRAAAMLQSLDSEARGIVTLHLVEELTFREIAEITGRPQGTVVSIYYRALKRLREKADSDSEPQTGTQADAASSLRRSSLR